MVTFSFKIHLNREYPAIWLMANFLTKLWDLKKSKKFSKNELRSQLLADNSLQKKFFAGLDFNMTERLIFDTFD